MELSCLGFAKSSDHADCLHRGEAAHQADHRAEDADFGAAIAVIGIMSVPYKTAVAGLAFLPAAKCADLAVELADSRRNQRHSHGDAQVIHNQPRRKIVAPVDHDINAVEQSCAGFAGHPLAQRPHRDIGVKLLHDPFHHLHFGFANISLGIKYLPLKVGTTDIIIINHAQPANASGGKILNRRAADPARTNDQDMCVQQIDLSYPANLLQDDMAGVAVKLFIAKFS